MENKLKIAAEQFYLGLHLDQPLMSDQEYDALVKEYESTGKCVKDLVDWPDQLVQDNEPEEPLDKEIVTDNDLGRATSEFCLRNAYEHADGEVLMWCNLKYDGGAIKLIYDESGRLQRIQSTPDEKQGIVRTEQFWEVVPHQIDPALGIRCIRGEVLVDPTPYGKLARNKANGLINSTVSQDEITKEAFIRWYKITYFDGNWTCSRQHDDKDKIPTVILKRMRPIDTTMELHECKDLVFAPAYEFLPDECPKDALVQHPNGDYFQADGVVCYTDTLGIKGFKFYFTDYAITMVKDVVWNRQNNGSYAAVLSLEPITLDDKYIQKASSNGVPKMIRDHCGVGAKVKVILANTTIPKVVEVLEGSDDFNFPTCGCGYQLSENDIFGSTLKCGNPHACLERVNKWAPQVGQWLIEEDLFKNCTTVREAIVACPKWFGYLLFVDRWDPFNDGAWDPKKDEATVSETLIKCLDANYEAGFRGWVQENFNFTELQWNTADVNIGSAFQVLRSLDEAGTFENIKQLITY